MPSTGDTLTNRPPPEADSRTLTSSSRNSVQQAASSFKASSDNKNQERNDEQTSAKELAIEAAPDGNEKRRHSFNGSEENQTQSADEKNVSKLEKGEKGNVEVSPRKERESWNMPRENTWRFADVLLAFWNFGLNDASYGVSPLNRSLINVVQGLADQKELATGILEWDTVLLDNYADAVQALLPTVRSHNQSLPCSYTPISE